MNEWVRIDYLIQMSSVLLGFTHLIQMITDDLALIEFITC